MENQFVLASETHQIIGACFEVYNEKGCGFLETIYQECLEIELRIRQIPFEARRPIPISYKQYPLHKTFEPDFCCFGLVVVEIKAVSELVDEHRAQLLNYLNASRLHVGLLVSFGSHPRLQVERFANTRTRLANPHNTAPQMGTLSPPGVG